MEYGCSQGLPDTCRLLCQVNNFASLKTNEALNELYFSPGIIRVIKSRAIRWAGHVARMGIEERYKQGFWWVNMRER